jgi:2-methylcitrate dehydratase PrpD
VDAQFSAPFGAAVALLYGKAGLDEFQLSKIKSEKVKRAMRLVECVVDPELDRTFPKQWGATAEILTREGKKYFAKVDYCKGDPENPLSWDELVDKFHGLCHRRMTKERRLKVVEDVRRLEKVRNLKKWSSLLLRDR